MDSLILDCKHSVDWDQTVHGLHWLPVNYTVWILVYLQQLFKVSKWAASWQNQQNDLCTQQRLGSAWASGQSDQSLLSAYAQADLNLHWVHSHFVGFVMRQLKLLWFLTIFSEIKERWMAKGKKEEKESWLECSQTATIWVHQICERETWKAAGREPQSDVCRNNQDVRCRVDKTPSTWETGIP